MAIRAQGQALEAFLSSPDLWQTPRDGFVENHRDLGFYWLSNTKDHAESRIKGLTLFSQPVYEVDADFSGDKLSGLTVSIYNRGDAGEMTKSNFTTLVGNAINSVTTLTKAQAVDQGQNASDAVRAWTVTWQTPATQYTLQYSFTKESGPERLFRAEFIRLQLAPPERPKTFMAEALASPTPVIAVFDGPAHVKKEMSGDTWINGVPMVDQGQKGYCVVASAERVMRYYGVQVDDNELAELANTSASKGTSNQAMFDALKLLAQRLQVKVRSIEDTGSTVRQIEDLMAEYNRMARREHAPEIPDQGLMLNVPHIYSLMKPDVLEAARTHNKSNVDRFQQEVHDHIDQGIPLLWSVYLGILPEQNGPQNLKGPAGHMRLIIGYNANTNEILYSDSWGPGHELKRMSADAAWTITTGLNIIEPIKS